MNTLVPILCMLALVAGTGLSARWLPRVPLPLLQIAGGAVLGLPALGLRIPFDPQIFMLLFIPPMLFADGWQMPKREFTAYRWPILLLSSVMVLFTVGALGLFIHWVLPAMPLSVAFLLAAVLSPTDAVAVSAIVQRLNMPAKLQHILEGEALMNDAAALVAVKFAIAATLTRSFSLPTAIASFAGVAAGGVLVGVAFSWLFKLLHDRLLYWREDQPAPPTVLLLLMMPFPPYLIAEHLHLSGVLAAVAAGMAASVFDVRSSRFNAAHVQTQNTWNVVRFAFDGLIFVLVGMQLPALLQHLPVPPPGLPVTPTVVHLLLLTLGIAAALLAVRFIGLAGGAWISRRVMSASAPARAAMARTGSRTPSLAWAGLGALGGTRGGITLAAVLGVPLLMPDGSAFPARDLLVFEAAMVMVLSLLAASAGLPWLVRRMEAHAGPAQPDSHGRELAWARNRASRAALRVVASAPAPQTHPDPPLQDAVVERIRARVHHGYSHRLSLAAQDSPDRQRARQAVALERALRIAALQAERDTLHQLRMSQRINDETLRTLMREIDLTEIVVRSQPVA